MLEAVKHRPQIIDRILEIEKTQMSFIQIIPHYNIQNGRKIDNIVDGLHSMYRPLFDRIKLDKRNKKFIYKPENRFSYGILIEYNKISFYLGLPTSWQDWICQRMYSVHTNSITTLPNQEDYLNKFDSNNSLEWELQPRYKEFLSFLTDYRENAPIPSILSCQKDMKLGDKVLLEINAKPIDDLWKEKVIKLQSDYRRGRTEGVSQNISLFIVFDLAIKIIDSIFGLLDFILGLEEKKNIEDKMVENKINRVENTLSSASLQKVNYNGFLSKIRILSQSIDPIRRDMVAQTMLIALKDLSEDSDNEFRVIGKTKNKTNRPKVILHYNSHCYSIKELGQVMQLPERKWQNEYMVEKVDVQEIELPKELFQNGIPIGEVSWKGIKQTASWNDKNKDVSCLPKVIFGFQGYGKTEYQIQYAIESIKHGHAAFIIDGIKKCEMSSKILNYLPCNFPENKIIVLRPCDLKSIIPLAWNEVDISEFKSPADKYKYANNLTQQLILLIDSLVEDNSQKLTPRMRRYLTSASTLVFSLPDTNIVDVLDVLDDYSIRHEFIQKSGLSIKSKIIQDLLKLDSVKKDKDGNIIETGTRDQDIKFIVDRLDLLLSDFVLRQLFLAKPNPEINFTKWADEGYCVIIQMPEDDVNISTIDTITTFLISKLWLAMQKRKNERQVDVIIDEIHRLKTAKKQLDNIREHRKRRLHYFFSAHQPSDFGNMLDTLKSAGASFMLLGTSKKNLEHFEQEIKPFTIEECLQTKKYHVKCIVNYDKEYVTFDAKLPQLVEKTEQFKDRSYLVEKCAKKYGVQLNEFF